MEIDIRKNSAEKIDRIRFSDDAYLKRDENLIFFECDLTNETFTINVSDIAFLIRALDAIEKI